MLFAPENKDSENKRKQRTYLNSFEWQTIMRGCRASAQMCVLAVCTHLCRPRCAGYHGPTPYRLPIFVDPDEQDIVALSPSVYIPLSTLMSRMPCPLTLACTFCDPGVMSRILWPSHPSVYIPLSTLMSRMPWPSHPSVYPPLLTLGWWAGYCGPPPTLAYTHHCQP